MYNAAVMAHMVSSGQQAAISTAQQYQVALTGTAGLTGYGPGQPVLTSLSAAQYTWPVQAVEEVFESQRWLYVRKSKEHGKKVGETAGIILVDVNGVERRLTMEELAVAAGWEW